MAARPTVVLNGHDLTIEDIVAIGIGDARVELDPEAVERCRESRDFLKAEIDARRIIYGVNTSFGPMCNKIIEDSQIEDSIVEAGCEIKAAALVRSLVGGQAKVQGRGEGQSMSLNIGDNSVVTI